MTYNGWANYETWNVSLWIANDYPLYTAARAYSQTHRDATYMGFVRSHIHTDKAKNNGTLRTPDGVQWNGWKINHQELDDFIKELGE
jgi:hypothetical protein